MRAASRRRKGLAPPPAGFMTARRPELPHAEKMTAVRLTGLMSSNYNWKQWVTAV